MKKLLLIPALLALLSGCVVYPAAYVQPEPVVLPVGVVLGVGGYWLNGVWIAGAYHGGYYRGRAWFPAGYGFHGNVVHGRR